MDRPSDVARKAVRSTPWVVVEKWSTRVTTFAVFLVLGRLLDPADFGLVALASVFVTILTDLLNNGFARTLVQRKELSELDKDTAFWTSSALAAIFCAGLFLAAPYLAAANDAPRLTLILRSLSVLTLFAAVSSVPGSMLERNFRFRSLAVRRLGGAVAGGLAGVVTAVLGWGAWALVSQFLVSSLVSLVLLQAQVRWVPRWRFSRSSLAEMFGYGATVMLGELVVSVGLQVDKLIVGAFFGPTTLGYYFVAFRIIEIVVELATGVFGRVSFTTFSRIQDDLDRRRKAFRLLTVGTTLTAVPALALLAVLGTDSIVFAFGEKWRDSGSIATILAVAFIFGVVVRFDRGYFLAIGRSGVALRMTLIRAVLGSVLVLAAAPFGLMWVVWARSARELIYWPMRMYSLKRYGDLPPASYAVPYLRLLVPIGLASGVAWLASLPLADAPVALRLCLVTLAYVASLGPLLWLTARSLIREAMGVLRRSA
jgi:PST family polysaccharide transporter